MPKRKKEIELVDEGTLYDNTVIVIGFGYRYQTTALEQGQKNEIFRMDNGKPVTDLDEFSSVHALLTSSIPNSLDFSSIKIPERKKHSSANVPKVRRPQTDYTIM